MGDKIGMVMREKLKKMHCLILAILFLFLHTGCSYMVKNEEQWIYSKTKYGIDKFIVVHDYHIHYVEVGEGQPIFLIPGAFSTYRHWNRMVPYLSKHYKLFCVDYLGVGDSDKPRSGFGYTIEEQTDVFIKMMEKLKISKAHIVGVSYGGMIALNLGTRYPGLSGKIVCIEGGVAKPKKQPHHIKKGLLGWPMIGDFFVSAVRSGLFDKITAKSVMGKAWEKMSVEGRQEIVEIISHTNKTASRASWYRISRIFESSKDFVEEIKAIQVPVLYLYGMNSEFRQMSAMTVEFFKTYLPNVEIVSFEDGIHDLQLQKPGEVARLILEFLAKSRTNEQNAFNSDTQTISKSIVKRLR